MGIFKITGKVINSQSAEGIVGLRVEAWDKDLLVDDLVGSAITVEGGVFRIQFDESYFTELFVDRKPDLFFKVFRRNQLLKDTKNSVLWNVDRDDIEHIIEIEEVNGMGSPESGFNVVKHRGNEVFRFVTLRPFQRQSDEQVSVKKVLCYEADKTELHGDLIDASNQADAREKMLETAREFIEQNARFVSNINELWPTTAPRSVDGPVSASALGELEEWMFTGERPIEHDALLQEIRDIYSCDPDEIIGNAEPSDVQQGFRADRARLRDTIMALAIDTTYAHPQSDRLVNALRICRIIERLADDDPGLRTPWGIDTALGAAVLLPPDVFPLPSLELAQAQAATDLEAAQEEKHNTLRARRAALEVAVAELDHLRPGDFHAPPEPSQEDAAAAPSPPPLSIAGDWVPWVMNAQTIARLGDTTTSLFSELGIDPVQDAVPEILNTLEAQLAAVSAELLGRPKRTKLIRYGMSRLEFHPGEFDLPDIDTQPWLPGELGPIRVPMSHGLVGPSGVGELHIVKQHLLRYEAGEIAHIENVLSGEYKERVHRRLRRLEEEITYEEERKAITEKDLQSTDRFELKREASETIKEEHKADAGVTVTYDGPSVEVEAKAGYAYSHAKEQAKKTSVTYARDVTERSVSKLEEKVREVRVEKTIEEFEETNTHGIDNKENPDHTVGIYRWVDKLYEMQVVNYGQRLFFDFVIPEPAALYLYALTHSSTTDLEAPVPPVVDEHGIPCDEHDPTARPLRPTDINRNTYQTWMSRYNISGIDVFPARYRYIGDTLTGSAVNEEVSSDGDGGFTRILVTKNIAIDDGYTPVTVVLVGEMFTALQGTGLPSAYTMITGNKRTHTNTTGLWHVVNAMQEPDWMRLRQTKQIPLAVAATNTDGFAATVWVLLERTPQTLEQWQHNTYDAVIQAYLRLKADYEESVAAAAIQEGISISGRNPEQNRDIEQTELKRCALSLVTGQYFELFDAMQTDSQGLPAIDFAEAEAEGAYIQFFEWAFEWPLMTYLFYPYFWGQRQAPWEGGLTWLDKITNVQDVDPLFEAFLKAGAARVRVPVRPGYEDVILNYVATGEIWNGEERPQVDDPLYVSIVEEIQQQQGVYVEKNEGTLKVVQGNAEVEGNGTNFAATDEEREIYIEGKRYIVAQVDTATALILSEPYQGETNNVARYYIGAKLVGAPWEAKVPTSLVYLQADATLPEFTED